MDKNHFKMYVSVTHTLSTHQMVEGESCYNKLQN